MRDPVSQDLTGWLRAWSEGDPAALERLVPVVYGDLRRMARRQLRQERPGNTLQTADLVHELYLRLVGQGNASWENRIQFFAVCSRLLRRILVDHARRRRSTKRGGDVPRVPIEAAALVAAERDEELLAIEAALEELEELDPRKARLVELRFFGGLTIAETGVALACSESTVEREWRAAKAWLHREARRTLPSSRGREVGRMRPRS